MEEVYNVFNKELKLNNKEVNQTRSSPDHMPCLAGQACWERALRHRIDNPMEVNT